MHVANRSQALAGGAGALTVGALAVGALVAPFVAPNVEAPVVQAPVALSASPVNTILGLLTVGTLAGQAAGGGVIGSAAQANVIYPSDSIVITNQLVGQVQNLIANPSQIPGAIVALPTEVETLTGLVEQQSTGVFGSGVVYANPPTNTVVLGYTLPGEIVPVTGNALTQLPTDPVNLPATKGFVQAATIVDTAAGAAGLPKLATPITRGTQAVGTSLIQAGGLVRSASSTAVQGTFNAVATGNPIAVVNSFRTGADGVAKSVLGDSSVKNVARGSTLNPLIPPGVGVVTGSPALDTLHPVKQLGAIRTVTTTVGAAVKGVADAATP